MNALPAGTEPLVLKDGTVINPIDGSIVEDNATLLIEVPSHTELQTQIVATRKRLADLPVPPQQMNTISVILTYSLMGVSEEDISIQLGLSLDQVNRIKSSDAYAEVQQQCVKTITESDKEFVRNTMIAYSKHAANRVISLIDSKRQDLALAASKDVLDRAGLRPADVIEHRHKIEGGLRIEYVDKQEKIPVIEHSEFSKEEF